MCQHLMSSKPAPYLDTIELYVGNTLSIIGHSLILSSFSLFKELRTKIMANEI